MGRGTDWEFVKYAEYLRSTFPTLAPEPDDLFLLEAHQVAQLPERAPPEDLAVVMGAHPEIARYFVAIHPPIASYLDAVDPPGEADVHAAEQRLMWEIADLVVYQRAPELYDALSVHGWDFAAVTDVAELDGKTVIDVGAGTGRVAFAAIDRGATVFAVEPAGGMRRFMREKADRLGIADLFVVDGTLDAVPLPAGSADVLITCRAIGWNLAAELGEVDRVLRIGAWAVHLLGVPPSDVPDRLSGPLNAAGYRAGVYVDVAGESARYTKQLG